jgi:hypothetical protein
MVVTDGPDRQTANMRGYVPKKPPAQFTTFELNTNYRSLSGIVKFAGSVVQTIYDLFPDSIDVMKPETAKRNGPSPIVFSNIRDEAGFFEQFLLGSRYDVLVSFCPPTHLCGAKCYRSCRLWSPTSYSSP